MDASAFSKYSKKGCESCMMYGYCRISTTKQNIESQVNNIKKYNPKAIVIKEVFTGTKVYGRKSFQRLLNTVKSGDTIIFDSVSRMSRDAENGFEIYQDLYNRGVELVFLKEPYINTSIYKTALSNNVELTGTKADILLSAVNEYLIELVREQIHVAFECAEKEVMDLRQNTREGIENARMKGKQIGRRCGVSVETKKSIASKKDIKKFSKDFGGSLNDVDCMRLLGIARNTYYKYKKELRMTLSDL